MIAATPFRAFELAGVEINGDALATARRNVAEADLHASGAESLPFADGSFDCVTCVEVLEHVPSELRAQALVEMRRVLRADGRLVLRIPHAGAFAFLDPNNLRFRLAWLYRWLIGRGLRDKWYDGSSPGVVWHHHFTKQELLNLIGEGWEIDAWRRGGLFLMPLVDLARWPFYRAGRGDHAISMAMQRLGGFDLGIDYAAASYDVLMILRRT